MNRCFIRLREKTKGSCPGLGWNRSAFFLLFLVGTALLTLASCGRRHKEPEVWVAGIKKPCISLNGTWKFSQASHAGALDLQLDLTGWKDIEVPGELAMQGVPVEHDAGYLYVRDVFIPGDFEGKRIFLRFDGVYSYARIWVNGTFIRDHHGGFTSWRCDITDVVRAGGEARIVVEVTDRRDDISYASGYAHHPIGGILRDVLLEARPAEHLTDFEVRTLLDGNYQNAEMHISAGVSFEKSASADIQFFLYDQEDREIRLDPSSLEVSAGAPMGHVVIPVKNPLKWDAEHPFLHRLTARLRIDGRVVEKRSLNIGFRQVDIQGNQLLVNGMPVKLRGANRHDIHPLLGRRTTPRLDERDVILAKEANINFIRTSHYPPSEFFLRLCDVYGLYVEEETAVCFVGTHRAEPYRDSGASQDNPSFKDRYLVQLEEMVVRDRHHPSVILWSIGNENMYGQNFQKEYDWIKENDPTRPVVFSYPGRVPEGRKCFDVLSMHYPSYEGDLTQYGVSVEGFTFQDMPVIFDEWAHVACYNTDTLGEDPNVRNFWGESLNRFWEKAFEAEGALGGAVWGMIDEVFMLPDRCTGYGPWGILDGWRRKKPEYWHVRKAYSPLRVTQTRFDAPTEGQDLEVPVHNRFDHTDLAELRIVWSKGKKSGVVKASLPPRHKGLLKLPGQAWNLGESLMLSFFKDGRLVDEERLSLSEDPAPADVEGSRLKFSETGGRVFVDGRYLGLAVNQVTGLIMRGGNAKAYLEGPFFHLRTLEKDEGGTKYRAREVDGVLWTPRSVNIVPGPSSVSVEASGDVEKYRIVMHYTITDKGVLEVEYSVADPPRHLVQEIGLSFLIPDDASSISWDKESLWTVYPERHIGRASGSALARNSFQENYREEPDWGWERDGRDYFLFGPEGRPAHRPALPFDFKSLKTGIKSFAVDCAGESFRIVILGSGRTAARIKADDQGWMHLVAVEGWDYKNLDWGNYERNFIPVSPFNARLSLRLVERETISRR